MRWILSPRSCPSLGSRLAARPASTHVLPLLGGDAPADTRSMSKARPVVQPMATSSSPEGEPRSPVVDAAPCICTTGLGQRVRAVRRAYGLREKRAPDTAPVPLRRDAGSRQARSVDLASPDGADPPSKAQVGAGHRRSGPHARIVAIAIAPTDAGARLKPIIPAAGAARSRPAESDRADVAARTLTDRAITSVSEMPVVLAHWSRSRSPASGRGCPRARRQALAGPRWFG